MLKIGNKFNMTINFLNLKLLFLIILSSAYMFKNAFGEENYIVTIVNKIPITKVDISNRAKLISLSINKNSEVKNLKNYYSESHQTLINEKIIFSAGEKINKNLPSIVSNQANQMLLAYFGRCAGGKATRLRGIFFLLFWCQLSYFQQRLLICGSCLRQDTH